MRCLPLQRLIVSAIVSVGILGAEGRHAAAQPSLILSQVSGAPGTRVTFSGSLAAGGSDVAAVQGDITFDPLAVPIAGAAVGNPFCGLNPGLSEHWQGVFSLPLAGCSDGTCNILRAIVLPLQQGPILALPQVTQLFTCDIDIAPDAMLDTYPLSLSRVRFGDPEGLNIDGAGVGGSVDVVAAATPTPSPSPSPTATPTPRPCAGDCNGDRDVPINELIAIVNIALGNLPLSSCGAGDVSGNGEITIDEILQAVNVALAGCPAP